MATFTWTVTTAGSTAAWETPAAWFDSTDSGQPALASFIAFPGNDYLINTSNSNQFTIDDIGAGGTAAPDIANSLTLSDIQATLALKDGAGALDVTTNLTLNSLLNLGTAVGGSVLSMGAIGAAGGTISLQANGRLEGALNDSIQNLGTTPTEIMGSGTVIAEGGVFQIGTSVQVAAGATTQFKIDPNATLAFADAVSGGTVVFTTNSGSGVLDVGELSTFKATLKNPTVGTIANKATLTSYIDFLNVGTNATATLSGVVKNAFSTTATLNVFANGGSQTIPIVSNYVGSNPLTVNYVPDGPGGVGGGGIDVFLANLPCYAAGTAILTPKGEAPVETIRPGDVVMTCDAGRLVPQTVIWTGLREIDLARHPNPASAAPIRFLQGALGENKPHRDLFLSPDHCLFIDGGLIPAKLLVNGMTIVRDLSLPMVSYHHIELDRHAVLIAEGVPAESYLDTGNRAYFGNAGLATILHPEFAVNEHLRCWETDACAPLLTQPEDVEPIWESLANWASLLGFEAPLCATTTDPALRLEVDGSTVRPFAAGAEVARFVVPEGAKSVRLTSRHAARIQTRPWLNDPRRLGVAVRSIRLRDRDGETVLGADHPALTDGWHRAEYSPEGAPWRWTDGDAALPIVSNGPCLLEIALSGATTYTENTGRRAA